MRHFVDIIYALSRHIHPYYYGNVAIIHAFFARDLSLFNGCRYNLCILVRHIVDLIYAFAIETYPYYYGDVAIIYAFSHEIFLF